MNKALAKNEEKSWSTCLISPFWLIPGTRKSDFWVPDPSQIEISIQCSFFLKHKLGFFRIAKRLGLKSKSYGKGDDRFITISRKFDANQLIEELKRQGGSTEKYELIYPKWKFSSYFQYVGRYNDIMIMIAYLIKC